MAVAPVLPVSQGGASSESERRLTLVKSSPHKKEFKPHFEGGNFSYTDRTLETVLAVGGLLAVGVLATGVYLINKRLRH